MSAVFRKNQLQELKNLYTAAQLQKLVALHGSPLMVINKKMIIDRYKHLVGVMPRVTPHFAVKSCPIPELLKIYKSLGAHLDIATNGEIDILKSMGYPASKAIHTHPHKKPEQVKNAFKFGIRDFVFDCVEELDKLEPYKKNIRLIFRLSFPNKVAHIDLSYKFGLEPGEAVAAVKVALGRGFNVPGVCFHVGSQVGNPSPFVEALNKTSKFCKDVKKQLGHTFELLDIGGGFPAPYLDDVPLIEEYAKVINPMLDKLFPGMRVASEPGRYLVNPAIFVLSSVITANFRKGRHWIYIDDGAYGSFSDMMSGHMHYMFYALSELEGKKPNHKYVIGGPTCDSLDILDESTLLPTMKAGEIIVSPNMGAYSWALMTEFNSLPRPKVVVI